MFHISTIFFGAVIHCFLSAKYRHISIRLGRWQLSCSHTYKSWCRFQRDKPHLSFLQICLDFVGVKIIIFLPQQKQVC